MSVEKIVSTTSAPTPSHTNKRAAAPATNEASAVGKTPVEPPALKNAQLEDIAKQLDSYIRSVSRSLEFKVDDASGRTVISVRDSETGDLIRQIPNEEALRFAQMAEEQTIVLLKETV
jgi:flagellar protein FlaG